MVFVIIPAFNESSVISKTVNSLLPLGFQVVVVDDGSTDNTKTELKDLPIHYIQHPINLGQGAALQTGIEYALIKGADFIATFDADGQHLASDIQNMLQYLIENEADIVFGSRFKNSAFTNISFFRRLIVQCARCVNFIFTGILLSDAHNGIRVFNRKFASGLQLTENGMAHASEFLFYTCHQKLKYAEYPVTVFYTPYSKAKGQGFLHSFKIIQDLFLHKIFK